MSLCSKCGKETPAYAAFCPFCGTSLAAVPSSPSQTTPLPSPEVAEVPISYVVQTAPIPFDRKASRLELLVRILWGLLIGLVGFVYALVFGIIILVYSFIASVLNAINFFIILITGERWRSAFNWQSKLITKSATYYARLYNFWMRRAPYSGLMIDKRPDLGMEPEPSKTPGGTPA
jgi:hypothetical protein